ncbi:hypothetical protein HYU17_03845 [Candidatus Woesearchaeota archaeon]|nr:hypothetical protein [Candidatus Woesearchaeota archaeon]
MAEQEPEKEHRTKPQHEKHAAAQHHEHKAGAHEAHPAPEDKNKQTEIKISLPELKGVNLSSATAAIAVVLLLFVAYQAAQTYGLSKKVDATIAEAKELARLPEVEVTGIDVSSKCPDCTPLGSILSTVKAARLDITKEITLDSKSAESQQLIGKYGIKKLPTVIVTGETGKAGISGFAKADGALIYLETPAPYVDAATDEVKGLVSLAYINDSSCRECFDMMPAVQQLRSQIKMKEFKVVEKESEEGKRLVKDYELSRLPAFLVSNAIYEYPIGEQLAQAGSVKKDKTIALNSNPPYLNVSTGRITGIAQLILMNDSSCATCYDVAMHMPIVQSRFQVYLGSIKTVDAASAEGNALISAYNITAVPTMLITGDAAAYPQLAAIWPSVGTVEKDGTFVFREMSQIPGRPYKNLATGKVEQNVPEQSGQ